MTRRDDELGSKSVLEVVVDFLERLGSVGGGIAFVAGALIVALQFFVPLNDPVRNVASLVVGALAALFVVLLTWQRGRSARLRAEPLPAPVTPSAALRGLLPFEEGEPLPGRAHDVQELFTLVTSRNFRFGVLYGDSGAGKTSLLRAGLVPALREKGYFPLYLAHPTRDPLAALYAALAKESTTPPDANANLNDLLARFAPRGKKVVILIDQFEDFFLTNPSPASRASFIEWLATIADNPNLPFALLVGVRADSFSQLQNLAPAIPEPTSPRTTYQLNNFDTNLARQVLFAAAQQDDIHFDPELISAVITDLEIEGIIRPAELQIVGTRLKRANIRTLNQYDAAGRARGILSSYISDEIKHSLDDKLARLVLRTMTADAITKSPSDLSLDDIERSLGVVEHTTLPGSLEQGVRKILEQFVDARILIHTDEDKYNLVHDYLAPYVRTATEGVETNAERANRWLKRYLAEYSEDGRTRIPFRRLRLVQKHAAPDLKGSPRARELLRKSAWAFYFNTALIVLPILLLAGIYLLLNNMYYLSTEQEAFTGGARRIVVRRGNPQFEIGPGFGQIAVQTEFIMSDLDTNPQVRDEFESERLTGLWFEQAPGGFERWGEEITKRLDLITQVRALRWLGQSERAADILIPILANSQTDPTRRAEAALALGQLGQVNPALITTRSVDPMVALVQDTASGTRLRLNSARALSWWIEANPNLGSSEVIQALLDMVEDPQLEEGTRLEAVDILRQLSQVNPQAVRPEQVQHLLDLLSAPGQTTSAKRSVSDALGQLLRVQPNAGAVQRVLDWAESDATDSDLRLDSLGMLGALRHVEPPALAAQITQVLTLLGTDPQAEAWLRSPALRALGDISRTNADATPTERIPALQRISRDSAAPIVVRISAMYALGQQGSMHREALSPESIDWLLELVSDPGVDRKSLGDASVVAGKLAQLQPQIVTKERFQYLLALLMNPNAGAGLRSDAANLIEKWGPANPRVVTSQVNQYLVALIADPSLDSGVRVRAARALAVLAEFAPEPVLAARAPLAHLDLAPARSFLQRALAWAEYSSALHSDPVQVSNRFFALLEADTDSTTRLIGRYALFMLVLRDPARELEIRNELESLRTSSHPHWRIAAIRTLEMLSVADAIQNARAHPDQLAHIQARLEALTCADCEAHLAFAAEAALSELHRIENATTK